MPKLRPASAPNTIAIRTATRMATTTPGSGAHPRFRPFELPVVVRLPSANPAIP